MRTSCLFPISTQVVHPHLGLRLFVECSDPYMGLRIGRLHVMRDLPGWPGSRGMFLFEFVESCWISFLRAFKYLSDYLWNFKRTPSSLVQHSHVSKGCARFDNFWVPSSQNLQSGTENRSFLHVTILTSDFPPPCLKQVEKTWSCLQSNAPRPDEVHHVALRATGKWRINLQIFNRSNFMGSFNSSGLFQTNVCVVKTGRIEASYACGKPKAVQTPGV